MTTPPAAPPRAGGWLPPGLWFLVILRLRSAAREGAKRARTPSGALATLFTLVFLGGWLVPLVWLPESYRPAGSATVGQLGPVGLMLVWFGQVAIRGGGEVLGFQPSEADQLFAGPFSPEQLLRYKVTLLLFAWTLGGVFLSPMAMFYSKHPLGGLLAVLLVLPFLQLSAMVATMARRGGQRSPLLRGAFLIAFVGLVGAVMFLPRARLAAVWDALQAANEHVVGQVLLAPFQAGVSLLTAPTAGQLVLPALVMLGIDALLVVALLRLGRGQWLELASDGAQHMQQAISRYRSGGGVAALGGWWGVAVPMLPRMGGVGVIAWRRLVEIVRRPTTLGTFVGVGALVAAIGLFVPLAIGNVQRTSLATAMMIGALIWGTVLAPGILRLDFRADLDRMDQLLSLPLRPIAVVLGQLLPMAVLVTLATWLVFLGIILWAPGSASTGVLLGLSEPGFALVVIAIENALFLWFPVRMEAGEAALQSVGRNLMISFVGWALNGLAALAAISAGAAVLWLTRSGVLAVLAVNAALLPFLLGAVGAATWRFARFDPSVHIPR